MNAPARTVETLGAAVTEEMDATYTLVYNEQGDTLPEGVVAAIVRGDNEWKTDAGERLDEWASEVRWTSACERVDGLAEAIVHRWEREDSTDDTEAGYADLLEHEWPSSEERVSAISTVMDRDDSTWYDDLVNQYGAVLLRVTIPAMDEDAGLSFEPMTAESFLDRLGFEHTDHNIAVANEIIANASPEFTVAMGYAMAGVDLKSICDLPSEGKVEIRNPHVWLGSPFIGSGYCGDDPLTGTLTVDRADLRTDKDAFGCSWGETAGGVSASSYAAEIAPAPAEEAGTGVDA